MAGGNATLDPMQGMVVEAGTRGQTDFGASGNLSWELALYYARINDEILSVENPVAPGTSLTTNVDRTIHAGIEASVFSRLGLGRSGERFLEPRLSLTLNHFHFDGDVIYGNNRLPAAPEYVLRGEMIYRTGSGFYAGPTLDFVGERYADFANRYTVDSYTLLGLRAGFSTDQWSVYADIRNLLDDKYIANHGVRNIAAPSDAILNPGAPLSAYFGIGYQID